jgi:hypothetical protein
MRGSTVFAALAGVAFSFAALPAHAIIGGTNDADDPAVVAVKMPVFGAYCSGSLVAPRLVLTAGHCLDEKPSSIVIGESESSESSVKVVSTSAHPKYTAEGADFDLAVLVLEHDAPGVTPLVTNHRALDIAIVGKDVRHVGFGTDREGNLLGIGDKHTITYPVTTIDATKVYSGSNGKNTCDGDSGGPALFTGDDGIERIIAVVSNGPSCHEVGWDIRLDHPEVVAWLDPLITQYGGLEDSHDGGAVDAGPVDAGSLASEPSAADAPSSPDASPNAPAPNATPARASGCAAMGRERATPISGALVFAVALAVARYRRSRR